MDLSSRTFDPPTIELMGRVCDDAWREVLSKHFFPAVLSETECRTLIAHRVMSAVAQGERDPEQLKSRALYFLTD